MVDFLFVIIVGYFRRYLLGLYGREIGRSRRFSKGWVALRANFRGNGASPTVPPSTVGVRKLVVALSCGIKMSVVHCLVLSQSTRVTDRRTSRITTANALVNRIVSKLVIRLAAISYRVENLARCSSLNSGVGLVDQALADNPRMLSFCKLVT